MMYLVSHLLTFGAMVLLGKVVSGSLGAAISYRKDPEVVGQRTVGGFLRYCFPRELWTNRNVRIDACFLVLNRLTSVWFVFPVLLTILAVTPAVHKGLIDVFGAQAPRSATLGLQLGLVVVCIIARDFMEFATHALSHRWQVLWEFHRVHHSSSFLSPFGEKRSHFVDDLWRNVSIAIVVGLCVAVYTYGFGLTPEQGTLFGVPAYVAAYTLANVANFEVLHHSHIPLSYGLFERVLISPAQHHLHHDRQGPSRNFGSFLAIWDRLFGSFAHSVPPSSFELGLPYEEQRHYMTIPEMYFRPFIGATLWTWEAIRGTRKMGAALPPASSRAVAGSAQAHAVTDEALAG